MSKNEHFPETQLTWIQRHLEGGQRDEVNRHVMESYGEPLRIYLNGHHLKWMGEADDLINGFFESRLSREDWFEKWRDSGRRLRHWIVTSFGSHYLKEQQRKVIDERKRRGEPLPPAIEADEESPDEAMDAAFARSIVKTAQNEARAKCDASGLGEHFRVFERHEIDGAPYADLAEELGLDPSRVRRMLRTAKEKFHETLRDLVRRELPGAYVTESQVDEELRILMRSFHS